MTGVTAVVGSGPRSLQGLPGVEEDSCVCHCVTWAHPASRGEHGRELWSPHLRLSCVSGELGTGPRPPADRLESGRGLVAWAAVSLVLESMPGGQEKGTSWVPPAKSGHGRAALSSVRSQPQRQPRRVGSKQCPRVGTLASSGASWGHCFFLF